MVLHIQQSATPLPSGTTGGTPSFRVQSVERVSTALARIGGGDVDAVLLDLRTPAVGLDTALELFRALNAGAPQIPTIILCGDDYEELAHSLMAEGAAAYVTEKNLPDGLAPAIQTAIAGRCMATPGQSGSGSVPNILGFIGAKGGVGVTTLALNVAAALAAGGRVALVELETRLTPLARYFHAPSSFPSISTLLHSGKDFIGRSDVQACMWPCRRIPGLDILFGPQTLQECGEIPPAAAKDVLFELGQLADVVVVDLGADLSAANRVVIPCCAALGLVLERDPICLHFARTMLQDVDRVGHSPSLVAPILVNRSSLYSPFPIADVDRELGVAPLAVIAPAPDLLLAAQTMHQPVVAFQPESAVAISLLQLTHALTERAGSLRNIVDPIRAKRDAVA